MIDNSSLCRVAPLIGSPGRIPFRSRRLDEQSGLYERPTQRTHPCTIRAPGGGISAFNDYERRRDQRSLLLEQVGINRGCGGVPLIARVPDGYQTDGVEENGRHG